MRRWFDRAEWLARSLGHSVPVPSFQIRFIRFWFVRRSRHFEPKLEVWPDGDLLHTWKRSGNSFPFSACLGLQSTCFVTGDVSRTFHSAIWHRNPETGFPHFISFWYITTTATTTTKSLCIWRNLVNIHHLPSLSNNNNSINNYWDDCRRQPWGSSPIDRWVNTSRTPAGNTALAPPDWLFPISCCYLNRDASCISCICHVERIYYNWQKETNRASWSWTWPSMIVIHWKQRVNWRCISIMNWYEFRTLSMTRQTFMNFFISFGNVVAVAVAVAVAVVVVVVVVAAWECRPGLEHDTREALETGKRYKHDWELDHSRLDRFWFYNQDGRDQWWWLTRAIAAPVIRRAAPDHGRREMASFSTGIIEQAQL